MDFLGKKFDYLFSPFRDKCCAMIDVISHLKRQNICFLQRVKIPVLMLSIMVKGKKKKGKINRSLGAGKRRKNNGSICRRTVVPFLAVFSYCCCDADVMMPQT